MPLHAIIFAAYAIILPLYADIAYAMLIRAATLFSLPLFRFCFRRFIRHTLL